MSEGHAEAIFVDLVTLQYPADAVLKVVTGFLNKNIDCLPCAETDSVVIAIYVFMRKRLRRHSSCNNLKNGTDLQQIELLVGTWRQSDS